jgi:molecular chaperone GrpE
MSKKNTKVKKENKKPKSKDKDLEVDIVKNDVDDIQKEKEKFLRLFAEFENYKKRTSRERIELFSTASQELMTSLLPVLDDFDRANQEIIKNSDDEIYKGVSLIQNKLFDTLKSKGLKIVEVNKGDSFDAEDHEAVTQIAAPSEDLKGKIIDVIEKGYKLGEKVIRYPKVVIGK